MALIGVRDLARRTREVIEQVERSGEIALVTKHGRPSVAIVPIDAERIEDLLLANAAEFVRGMRLADEEVASGRTTSLSEVLLAGASRRSRRDHGRRPTARSKSRRSTTRSTR